MAREAGEYWYSLNQSAMMDLRDIINQALGSETVSVGMLYALDDETGNYVQAFYLIGLPDESLMWEYIDDYGLIEGILYYSVQGLGGL